ncbi:MAG: hypothetical protein EWV55_10320 [Microcystis viridis Mv_BB_P_19951000_S69]|uniref:Uncharacterized protein n=1 Tax=Microcystis viridis Mv_BB_P_19951000_S68D TaxID=2486270 RepID=A0A552H6Y1_MICVR|nr:MAG: hypothetical protein EWV77_23615 [Microcystis viridis Mv_BB_P_19951000_S68D]TRU72921.1 MAG: hypothetical protein EWV47_14155 [Microcystis viridis Mv_BB_P_19951000_S68]TRU74768.1 MAG: hypothetical protein EWV55_10320 [Microcystis viridis Mv_BB_P_19951000_S69]TRU82433.1 MAG: hypothetical protein EWV46_18790 [Microcystis viridis Mv_BB_P_19951000_S69D]
MGWLGFAFSSELSYFRPSIVSLNPTYEAHSFNQCAWCVPQKSIGGAVEVALGNAPYKIAITLHNLIVHSIL